MQFYIMLAARGIFFCRIAEFMFTAAANAAVKKPHSPRIFFGKIS